jgi:hypothetical protein
MPSEDSSPSGLVIPDQLVQIRVLHQLEALHILAQLASHLLLLVPDEVSQVSHHALQIVREVEPQDLAYPQNQEIIV